MASTPIGSGQNNPVFTKFKTDLSAAGIDPQAIRAQVAAQNGGTADPKAVHAAINAAINNLQDPTQKAGLLKDESDMKALHKGHKGHHHHQANVNPQQSPLGGPGITA